MGPRFSIPKISRATPWGARREKQRRPARYYWAILIIKPSLRCCVYLLVNGLSFLCAELRLVFQGADRAGLFLLGVAAAFPSVAHAWILTVLQHMLIPESVVDAVHQLYRDIYTRIRLGGGTFRGYYSTR
eukprot:9457146-Pyramimonas_sp.AAC.1